jgi:hypothetical protein
MHTLAKRDDAMSTLTPAMSASEFLHNNAAEPPIPLRIFSVFLQIGSIMLLTYCICGYFQVKLVSRGGTDVGIDRYSMADISDDKNATGYHLDQHHPLRRRTTFHYRSDDYTVCIRTQFQLLGLPICRLHM